MPTYHTSSTGKPNYLSRRASRAHALPRVRTRVRVGIPRVRSVRKKEGLQPPVYGVPSSTCSQARSDSMGRWPPATSPLSPGRVRPTSWGPSRAGHAGINPNDHKSRPLRGTSARTPGVERESFNRQDSGLQNRLSGFKSLLPCAFNTHAPATGCTCLVVDNSRVCCKFAAVLVYQPSKADVSPRPAAAASCSEASTCQAPGNGTRRSMGSRCRHSARGPRPTD